MTDREIYAMVYAAYINGFVSSQAFLFADDEVQFLLRKIANRTAQDAVEKAPKENED